MNTLLKKLSPDKIKMNWNKNPIKMSDFLRFLTVDVVKSTNNFGYDRGWTEYNGDDGLIISGGIVGGIDYLNYIEYKKNLDNVYNNFVSPFYLFDIMNDEGRRFFLEYYRDDILKELQNQIDDVKRYSEALSTAKNTLYENEEFLSNMGFKRL